MRLPVLASHYARSVPLASAADGDLPTLEHENPGRTPGFSSNAGRVAQAAFFGLGVAAAPTAFTVAVVAAFTLASVSSAT